MRTTSQCSPGVRCRTVPTPSTWPCTMWPPSRVCALTARSRLTGSPAWALPRLLRRRVSPITSVLQVSPPSSVRTSVTVRQTPLTEIESPSATSSRTFRARISRRAASDWSSRTSRVPTSSTIPVNTSLPPVGSCAATSVPGGLETNVNVPAQQPDVADRQLQRVADRGDSQVRHQRRTRTEELRCEMHHDLVDQPVAEEGGGQRGAPFQQHAADVAGEELVEQREGSGRDADVSGGDVVQERGRLRQPAAAVHHDPQRLVLGVAPLRVPHGQLGVVGERG